MSPLLTLGGGGAASGASGLRAPFPFFSSAAAAPATMGLPIFFYSGVSGPTTIGSSLPLLLMHGAGTSPPAGGQVSFTADADLDVKLLLLQLTATADTLFDAGIRYEPRLSLTADADLNAQTHLVVLGSQVAFSTNVLFSAVAKFKGDEYRLVVTNISGWPFAELDRARLTSVTWELNAPGTAEFTMLTEDPKAPAVRRGREVQVWRGDQLLWWGPIIRPQATPTESNYQCAGLLWYLGRRHIGKADRENMVKNGDFEEGLARWDVSGTVTAEIVDSPRLSGTRVLKVTGHGPLELGETDLDFVYQRWTHRQSHPLGDLITLATWVWIPSGDYQGPSLGFYVHVRHATEESAPGVKRITQGRFIPLDAALPHNEWVPMEAEVRNVMADDEIEIRLYPPHGVAYYDLVVGVYMESLYFGGWPEVGIDQATIAGDLVLYAQSRPTRKAQHFDHGKSNLNIGVETPDTGVTYVRAYQHAEHLNIAEAINEYMQGDLGMDIDILVTPTTRTFTTYFPLKGTYRPELALEYGRNIAEFTWSEDGEQAATDVVVLGYGDGPDRPEGGARDIDVLGGLTLEKVLSASDQTSPGLLDDFAREELRLSRDPEIIEVSTYEGGGQRLIGTLRTGDVVPIRIRAGHVDVSGRYRIVRLALQPETDVLTITGNYISDADLKKMDPSITLEEAMARAPNAVSACRRPSGGVWVVASDGGVFSFGGAPFYGSMGGKALHAPMSDIVPHGDTGYWTVAQDGGIFAFGSAPVRLPYVPLQNEWANGDRAVIAVELEGADGLVLMADDGTTYTFLS